MGILHFGSISDDSGWFPITDDLHSLVAHQITVDSLAVCSTSDDSGQFGSMQYIR